MLRTAGDAAGEHGSCPPRLSERSIAASLAVASQLSSDGALVADQIAELGDFYMKDGEVSGYNETVEMGRTSLHYPPNGIHNIDFIYFRVLTEYLPKRATRTFQTTERTVL